MEAGWSLFLLLKYDDGKILPPMRLYSGKMWKSNVKKIIISFPTLACRSEVITPGTQVIAQSLKTRQQNGPKQTAINTCDYFIIMADMKK